MRLTEAQRRRFRGSPRRLKAFEILDETDGDTKTVARELGVTMRAAQMYRVQWRAFLTEIEGGQALDDDEQPFLDVLRQHGHRIRDAETFSFMFRTLRDLERELYRGEATHPEPQTHTAARIKALEAAEK